MADNKTLPTEASVTAFLNQQKEEGRKADCLHLANHITELTGMPARMWGNAIVGFGNYHYKYPSGREGDAPLVAFSPRKAAITVYLAADFPNRAALLNRLGKHKASGGCVHIQYLKEIDLKVLDQLIRLSMQQIREQYPD